MEKNLIIVLIIVVLIYLFNNPEVSQPAMAEGKMVVYLDPGHGGMDGGATFNGVNEKDVVLEIGLYLKSLFEGNGFICYMTRTGDYDLAPASSQNRKRDDLRKRAYLINNSNADLYLSIHANSFTSPQIYGSQTFYQSNSNLSQQLATCIMDSLKTYLQNTTRVPLSINDKFLIDNINKPGCLVEVGYLSNPNELKLLTSPEYQMKMANAIFLGVLDYLQNNNL